MSNNLLELIIPKQNIKVFSRAIQCLSKMGEEISFEAEKDKVILKSMNSAASVFCSFIFQSFFFEKYITKNGSHKFKILIKTLLHIFKGLNSLNSIQIVLPEQTKVQYVKIDLISLHYLKKSYKINYEEGENLEAQISKESFSASFQAPTETLMSIIQNFHNNITEISFVLDDQKLDIKSYIDQNAPKDILLTQVSVPCQDFMKFETKIQEKIEMTFDLKYLKYFLTFGEFVKSNIEFYMSEQQGNPILFTTDSSNDKDVDIHAELLIATLIGNTQSQPKSNEPKKSEKKTTEKKDDGERITNFSSSPLKRKTPESSTDKIKTVSTREESLTPETRKEDAISSKEYVEGSPSPPPKKKK